MFKLIFSLMMSVATCAASLTINFDSPTLSVAPGQTVTFSGTISNGFSGTVDLNSLNVNIAGSGFTVDSMPFFLGPVTVDGNSTTVNFSFFAVTLDDPFPYPGGIYSGTMDLLAGVQVGGIADPNVLDLLGSANFQLDVVTSTGGDVPEPASGAMVVAAVALLAGYRRRYCLPLRSHTK